MSLSLKIEEFIAERAKAKLEATDKKTVKDDILSEEDQRKNDALKNKYVPSVWIADAARRAKQIQFATHSPKYTHSDSEGSGINFPNGSRKPKDFEKELISTAVLEKPEIDVVGNAAAFDVVSFLQLEIQNKTLLEYLKEGNMSPLESFAESKEQLSEWRSDFLKIFDLGQAKSDSFAKQIYFPVEKAGYHLISPIFASSLVNVVFNQIRDAKFSDDQKAAREARREQKISTTIVLNYPELAIQRFGGSNVQNISLFNTKKRRNGVIYFLSSSPPSWRKILTLPLLIGSIFNTYSLFKATSYQINELTKYLNEIQGPDSVWYMRKRRAREIENIIDAVIQYGSEIQEMTEHAGWSLKNECKLPRHERLWLDKGRADTDLEFGKERDSDDWKEEVSTDFARWLNSRFKEKKLEMADVEFREWKHEMYETLKRID